VGALKRFRAVESVIIDVEEERSRRRKKKRRQQFNKHFTVCCIIKIY